MHKREAKPRTPIRRKENKAATKRSQAKIKLPPLVEEFNRRAAYSTYIGLHPALQTEEPDMSGQYPEQVPVVIQATLIILDNPTKAV